MDSNVLRLLIDFGLVILIWIVQLIIYPSFLYYKTENLVNWHRKYTLLIGYIVAPLLVLQLGIAIFLLTYTIIPYSWVNLVFVILFWLMTFVYFVPVHKRISKGQVSKKMLDSLVRKNWIRTGICTVLFVLSLGQYLIFTNL